MIFCIIQSLFNILFIEGLLSTAPLSSWTHRNTVSTFKKPANKNKIGVSLRFWVDTHSIGKVGFILLQSGGHLPRLLWESATFILCGPSEKDTFIIKYKKFLCGEDKCQVCFCVYSIAQVPAGGKGRVLLAVANVGRVLYAPDTFSLFMLVCWQVLLCCLQWLGTHGPPASAAQCHHTWRSCDLLYAFFFDLDSEEF